MCMSQHTSEQTCEAHELRQINNCSDKLSVLCTRTAKNSIYSSVEHMVQRSYLRLRKWQNFNCIQ